MSGAYKLGSDLTVAYLVRTVADAVTATRVVEPAVAALTYRETVRALVPAYKRGDPEHWLPETVDEAARAGAYAGAVDCWERVTWRGERIHKVRDDLRLAYTIGYQAGAMTATREAAR